MLVALAISGISFSSCSDDKTDDVINIGTEVSIEKTFLSSLIDDEEGQVTNLTYDSENRLITLISKIDSVLQYSVYVNYNADGKIVKSKIIEDSDESDLEVLKSILIQKILFLLVMIQV